MITLQQRSIAHFDLDCFFVSVECLKDSRLKGKPLLVGGHGDRAVVAACSYEARRYGIHSAMPMKTALKLCPHAIVRGGDMEKYSELSRHVTDIIADGAPLYEKSSIDEFYLDLTGMDKYFGSLKWTAELRQKIMRETGLPISLGLASNKMVSKVATNEAKPNGQMEIHFGGEKSFLAPMPVEKLPMVGKETAAQLHRRGVENVKTLSEIPVTLLEAWLGKNGISLWNKANGIDESPVVPYHEQKSISTESTFAADTIDMRFLHAELVRMTERVAFELRQQDKLTGCVTVKLRYSDFVEGLDVPQDVAAFFRGPTAVVIGREDPVTAAKVLSDFARENDDRPAVKAGVVERRTVSSEEVKRLAKLPPREQLLAELAGVFEAPMAQLLFCLQAKMTEMVGLLEALKEQREGA
jgi:DNA polymerase-4